MKIYTGSGDRGRTSLFSGERVAKGNERIEAYGDLDELNSFIGALVAALPEPLNALKSELKAVQAHLFRIGAWLATTPGAPAAETLEPIDPQETARLERAIDRLDETLPPLKEFILPGGHPCAAWAHIARTVCRRAERRLVAVAARQAPAESSGPLAEALVFLNRLSDYFFVLARHANRIHQIEDTPWKR
jgi:cob(I)alamin adenosyltransferase